MSKFDAVVIGAGTGGLSAALSLANAGKKVLLLEKHNLPGGCSTRPGWKTTKSAS